MQCNFDLAVVQSNDLKSAAFFKQGVGKLNLFIGNMKLLIFLACLCTLHVAISARTAIRHLTHGFEITEEQAIRCLNKTHATDDDFRQLGQHFGNEKKYSECSDAIKRVFCAFSCALQTDGSMIGSKLQLPKLHEKIDRAEVSDMTNEFHETVNFCFEQVKYETDACAVVAELLMCMRKRLEQRHI